MQILPPKHHHIPWGILCTGIIFQWVYSFRNIAFKTPLTHALGMHPAVLVWLILFLKLRYMMTECLEVIIVYLTCGLCSRECVMDLLPWGDAQVWLRILKCKRKGKERKGLDSLVPALPVGSPQWNYPKNALPIRQGWLAFTKPTNTACENDVQNKHKHSQGILAAGSPPLHDL